MTTYDYFLKELFEQQERTVTVKLTSLSFLDELPRQQITGRATGGSTVNVNGNSDIRRTCSINLIATLEEQIIEYQWALNNKFSVEVGVYNTVDNNYDNIIWFPMGVYVISSFSYSENLTSVNISISGKDKMCLLDGSVGGKLLAKSYDFGNIEEVDEDGNIKLTQIPIKTIIEEAVHMYAKEPYHNIIINDLDDIGLELMKYRGKDPLFVLLRVKEQTNSSVMKHEIKQMIFNADYEIETKNGIATIGGIEYYNPSSVILSENNNIYGKATQFWISDASKTYVAMKMEYGDVIGYHRTDLVYAGKLTANLGEGITSILTKIKNQLGQFEYFYNLNGQFVFQKKRNRLQENFSKIRTVNNTIEYVTEDYYGYEFVDSKLFSAISNAPQIDKVKNDYSIWGQKQDDNKTSVHMRYAIDKKPKQYTSIDGTKYEESDKCDWREIIYQMAKDYFRFHNAKEAREEDLALLGKKSFWEKIVEKNGDLYPLGVTGYEQYYSDMEGFWRQLYCPNPDKEKDTLPPGITFENGGPWSDTVVENPEALLFWIDFLDSAGEISNYSVKKIGDRTYGKSETSVTAVYYPAVPEIIYYWDDEYIDEETGESKDPEEEVTKDVNTSAYTFVNLPMDVIDLFSISSRGISAIEKMQETLYANAFCNETINLTSIPIYSLEVNSLIRVDLEGREQIKGDYVVNSVTIPLTYNGTMQISATKVIDNIY